MSKNFQLGREDITLTAEGIVKWFSDDKGYGFIEQENGQDLFIHYTSINMEGFKTLNQGDRVLFDAENTDRGPVARNVTRL